MRVFGLQLVCCWLCSVLYGQGIVCTTDTFKKQNITSSLAIISDSTDIYSCTAVIRKLDNQLLPRIGIERIHIRHSQAYQWLCVRLVHTGKAPLPLYLEFPVAYLVYEMQMGWHIRRAGRDSVVVHPPTGARYPFQARAVPHRFFLFPVTLQPGDTVTALLRLDLRGKSLVNQPVTLYSIPAFAQTDAARTYQLMLLYGIVAAFLGIVLLLLIATRRRLYLAYLSYESMPVFWMLCISGVGSQWLWPDTPFVITHLMHLYAIGLAFSMAFFVNEFFQVQQKYPALFRLLLIDVAQVCFLTTPMGLQYGFNVNVGYNADHMVTIATLIHITILVFILYKIYKSAKNNDILWFAAANVWSLLGTVLLSLKFEFNILINLRPEIIYPVSVIGQFAILTSRLLWNLYQEARSALESHLLLETAQRKGVMAFLEGQQAESRRIGEALHDQVGALTAALRLRLNHDLKDVDPTRRQPLIELVDHLHHEVRAISHTLMPDSLQQKGLSAALQKHIATLQGAGQWQVFLREEGEAPTDTDTLILLAIYQTTLELLQNAQKHAQATAVWVDISYSPASITLMVEDNGNGFDPNKQHPGKGIGLIMRRVQELRGTCNIASVPNQGTTVRVELPLG